MGRQIHQPFYGHYHPFSNKPEDNQLVHIFLKKRTNRKSWTTVQGLPSNVPMKKLLKSFRKNFHCNGCVVDDEKFGQVIQLQGDHRADIQKFLVSKKIVKAENIRIHG